MKSTNTAESKFGFCLKKRKRANVIIFFQNQPRNGPPRGNHTNTNTKRLNLTCIMRNYTYLSLVAELKLAGWGEIVFAFLLLNGVQFKNVSYHSVAMTTENPFCAQWHHIFGDCVNLFRHGSSYLCVCARVRASVFAIQRNLKVCTQAHVYTLSAAKP